MPVGGATGQYLQPDLSVKSFWKIQLCLFFCSSFTQCRSHPGENEPNKWSLWCCGGSHDYLWGAESSGYRLPWQQKQGQSSSFPIFAPVISWTGINVSLWRSMKREKEISSTVSAFLRFLIYLHLCWKFCAAVVGLSACCRGSGRLLITVAGSVISWPFFVVVVVEEKRVSAEELTINHTHDTWSEEERMRL